MNRHYVELVIERGFDDAIREMAHESPEWLGVMLETQAQLHHDPEFLRRMEPPAEQLQRVQDWLRSRQEDGTFRSDIAVERPRTLREHRAERTRPACRRAATRPTSSRSCGC